MFAVFGSATGEETVAVLLTVVPPVTVATSEKTADAPLLSVAAVQVTVVVPLQLNAGPEVCVIETNDSLTGKVSLSVIDDPCDGPLFVTVIV